MIRGALMALLLVAPLAWADGPIIGADCTFVWDAPTTNTDGSPITDLKEYRLYLSSTAGGYDWTTPAGPPVPHPTTQLTCAAAGLVSDGQYYAVVTARDEAGNQSGPSNEIAFVRETLSPGAPTTFTIQLTLTGTFTVRPQ